VTIETDADRLAQVFINLISNARKYCDADSPELEIAVRDTGQGVEVQFSDNGSGIPTRQEALIFEKFARLETARGAPGAGLGLAISREIMTRLNGDLSYVPGAGGATFRVKLPQRALRAA
jgi:signal transduction histidine kinase